MATHYRVNVGIYAPECFKHFDDEKKMFAWISGRIGKRVTSFDDCEKWNELQDEKAILTRRLIGFVEFDDIKEFFRARKRYAELIRKCNDIMDKARMVEGVVKRSSLLNKFYSLYDKAEELASTNPEAWYGEI